MDRARPHPLSVEQAKLRLLAQAHHVDPRSWIVRNPYTSLAISAVLGYIVARNPRLLDTLSRYFFRNV